MKIFINSYNRPEIISTHKLLDACGIDYRIVLHNHEQRELYLANPSISPEKILVSNMPVGMVGVRNWVLETQVKEGEWYLHLDDNITEFQCVPEPAYSTAGIDTKADPARFKALFETPVDAKRFLEVCEDSIKEAERRGAWLVGFASNLNFYFRSKKYRDVGYVIGKTQLIKKGDLTYDLNVYATDDYLWTAQNLLRYGRVLINNYAVAVKKHYAPGGIGVYDERMKWKVPEVAYLMKTFPELFRFKIKKGSHPKAEIQVRFTSLDQVEKWRAMMRVKKPV